MKRMRSLTHELLHLLLAATLSSVLLFGVIYMVSDHVLQNHFAGSKLQTSMTERRIEKLQSYISQHQLSTKDARQLHTWCSKQPVVLLEIYSGNQLLFHSDYLDEEDLAAQEIEATLYDWYVYYELQFSDQTAELLICSDESYRLRTWLIVAGLLVSGALYIGIVLYGIRRVIAYLYILCDAVELMAIGNFSHSVAIIGSNELTMLAEGLDHMRQTILRHHEEEAALRQKNQDMITGLSHDLRTPLTKLMLYVEVIENYRYSDVQQLHTYLHKIYEKGVQMKEISEHLLQYSLGEQQEIEVQLLFLQSCLQEPLSEMLGELYQRGFMIEESIEWKPVHIYTVELDVKRILDNVASNIEKYAAIEKPVSVRSVTGDGYVGFSFSNVPKVNQHTDSTQVGLLNLQTMMERMRGKCVVSASEERFEVEIWFRVNEK